MVLLSWYMTRVVVKNFSTDGKGCNARTGWRFSDKLVSRSLMGLVREPFNVISLEALVFHVYVD